MPLALEKAKMTVCHQPGNTINTGRTAHGMPPMMHDLSSDMVQRGQISLSDFCSVREFSSQQSKSAFTAPLRLWELMQILQVCGFSPGHVTPISFSGSSCFTFVPVQTGCRPKSVSCMCSSEASPYPTSSHTGSSIFLPFVLLKSNSFLSQSFLWCGIKGQFAPPLAKEIFVLNNERILLYTFSTAGKISHLNILIFFKKKRFSSII